MDAKFEIPMCPFVMPFAYDYNSRLVVVDNVLFHFCILRNDWYQDKFIRSHKFRKLAFSKRQFYPMGAVNGKCGAKCQIRVCWASLGVEMAGLRDEI
jgi:hypothetical protein